MKHIIAAILLTLCLIGIVRAHTPQPSLMSITRHIQQNGWWEWNNDKQKLAFCIGYSYYTQQPICIAVPPEYVVIKYIIPPQK